MDGIAEIPVHIDDFRQDSTQSGATTATSSLTTKIKRRSFQFGLLSYSVGFLFAAILSLGLTAFCLWMIYLDFANGTTFSVSGWCQSIITFLLGAWITDRPKFFKEDADTGKKKKKKHCF